MDTTIHSQPVNDKFNETAETDFNSTQLDDGTFFSSQTLKMFH